VGSDEDGDGKGRGRGRDDEEDEAEAGEGEGEGIGRADDVSGEESRIEYMRVRMQSCMSVQNSVGARPGACNVMRCMSDGAASRAARMIATINVRLLLQWTGQCIISIILSTALRPGR